MNHRRSLIVIGGGPAGLTAAYQALQEGYCPVVCEKSAEIGGIARTEQHGEYRFDIGGHRFYTRVPEIQELWQAMLGDDFRPVTRLSRIYYRGQFFDYPLEAFDALSKLGPFEISRILLSYLRAKLRPHPQEETYEDWMVNRFGRRLYEIFFKTYTEKVWGIPCDQIRADWAAQRIMGLSLRSVIASLFQGRVNPKSLIRQFYYPRLGPGMMWQKFHQAIEAGGGEIRLNSEVIALEHRDCRITGVLVRKGPDLQHMPGDFVISSMPVSHLIARLDPPPPGDVLEAARKLHHRDFLIVCLIVDRAEVLPDQWIYIHAPEVRAGRIQNFKNWSPAMVPDLQKSSLGVEYFCGRGGDLWQTPDDQLVGLATREMAHLGLLEAGQVEGGTVIRQPQAYPVYDEDYPASIAVVRAYLGAFDNLQTIGRNGMHRYNNMDHSMLTALLAVQNLDGADHDLWRVNTEQDYGEFER